MLSTMLHGGVGIHYLHVVVACTLSLLVENVHETYLNLAAVNKENTLRLEERQWLTMGPAQDSCYYMYNYCIINCNNFSPLPPSTRPPAVCQ